MAKKYLFTVTGKGNFPADMLRYDSATPYTPTDASLIEQERTIDNRRLVYSVRLISPVSPTVGRWNSFFWNVSAIERVSL